MASTGDTSYDTYNNLINNIKESDIFIGIKGNDAKIIKNKHVLFSMEKEVIDQDTLINMFAGFMLKNCKINFFLDSFRIDLVNSMKEVFKNYNVKIEFGEDNGSD